MSDETQPELTPKEQRQQDQERVQGQLVVTDVTRKFQGVMEAFGFRGSGSSGRTSFEGHELNAMIDLIEHSNPEQLEEAGEALWNARSSLNDAAQELSDFIGAVDWEGESGTAFRDWGKGLVAHARKLGEFAEAAGTQITVAGTGLASVRNSLPPRDTRLSRKAPDEIEAPKRIEGNPEYEAALKVEKHRQEAINQANRLASYYAVSQETLAAQEPPRFEKTLDVAMPRPQGRGRGGERELAPESTGSESVGGGSPQSLSEFSTTGNQKPVVNGPGGEAPVAVAPVLQQGTSTEINSVSAPPVPVTPSSTSPGPPPTGPAGPSGGPVLPVANGFVNPVTNSSSRRTQGPAGGPRAVGQPGTGRFRGGSDTGSGPTANGRSGPTVGRPTSTGGGSASGTTGRGGGGSQPPTAGRSGVTGGRPVTGGGHTGRTGTSGPPAGRANGIMGGTPQRATPGSGTPGGARGGPRGPVIGGGATQSGGTTGGAGRRGVIGGGMPNSAPRPGGKGTSSTNGVVGKPRGGAPGAGAGSRGFTAGGAGLVRGPAGRRDSDDEDQDEGTSRPDYLTEDRETWEAGRREAAPPVIE
ncbi:WXG100 family type VII secretion target [Streptomyces halstedii]|uniref:WXG100 family type VII secretion target n=1 Tax=Streptomyces halstedii TaxID=1944 RepID=UPI0036630DA5